MLTLRCWQTAKEKNASPKQSVLFRPSVTIDIYHSELIATKSRYEIEFHHSGVPFGEILFLEELPHDRHHIHILSRQGPYVIHQQVNLAVYSDVFVQNEKFLVFHNTETTCCFGTRGLEILLGNGNAEFFQQFDKFLVNLFLFHIEKYRGCVILDGNRRAHAGLLHFLKLL